MFKKLSNFLDRLINKQEHKHTAMAEKVEPKVDTPLVQLGPEKVEVVEVVTPAPVAEPVEAAPAKKSKKPRSEAVASSVVVKEKKAKASSPSKTVKKPRAKKTAK